MQKRRWANELLIKPPARAHTKENLRSEKIVKVLRSKISAAHSCRDKSAWNRACFSPQQKESWVRALCSKIFLQLRNLSIVRLKSLKFSLFWFLGVTQTSTTSLCGWHWTALVLSQWVRVIYCEHNAGMQTGIALINYERRCFFDGQKLRTILTPTFLSMERCWANLQVNK